MPPDFDWFKRGVWIARDRSGDPILVTAASTATQCRANLCRRNDKAWLALFEQGYTIREFKEQP